MVQIPPPQPDLSEIQSNGRAAEAFRPHLAVTMSGMSRMMHQTAPYPDILADLVDRLRYREDRGWEVHLHDDYQRDKPGRHTGESRGLTLVITRCGPDSYHPERIIAVNHLFAVPPATYNEQSWRRWLFDRLGDVDTHERMEDFAIEVEDSDSRDPKTLWRPYAPVHAPGHDPYMVAEQVTDEARRTSFKGELNEH